MAQAIVLNNKLSQKMLYWTTSIVWKFKHTIVALYLFSSFLNKLEKNLSTIVGKLTRKAVFSIDLSLGLSLKCEDIPTIYYYLFLNS